MSFGINAQQANQNKRNDLAIFEEQCAIMRRIIEQSSAGACSITINDTTMTQSTANITVTGTVQNPTLSNCQQQTYPAVSITGTVQNPVTVVGDVIAINGTNITMTGTDLAQAIIDVNNAGITGIVASNDNNALKITYTPPNSSNLNLVMTDQAGVTAFGKFGFTDNQTVTSVPTGGTCTIVINGTTVTLGTTGTNLNSIIADINDANVSGVVASKNANNQIVITYTAPASTTWQLVIGAGTANTDLGLTNATTTATNPASVTYYQVSQGSTVDICSTEEMNEVLSYFRNLGFDIEQQTNTTTGKTFQWVINY